MRRGILITVEGIEGAGKTTQAKLLKSYLEEQGYSVLLTREPGGSPISEQIRQILIGGSTFNVQGSTLRGSNEGENKCCSETPSFTKGKHFPQEKTNDDNGCFRGNITPKTELLLFAASRAQHVEEVILPALLSGKIVISDRFADSTFAYQGYGRGLIELASLLNQIATGNLEPDLTLILDMDVEDGLERIRLRAEMRKSGKHLDRLEKEDLAFHKRVREGYLAIAKQFPQRVKLIQGSGTIAEVQGKVRKCVDDLLRDA